MYHVAEGLIVKLGNNIVLETPQRDRTILFDKVKEFHMAERKALLVKGDELRYLFFEDIFKEGVVLLGVKSVFGVHKDRFIVHSSAALNPDHFFNIFRYRAIFGNPLLLYDCGTDRLDLWVEGRQCSVGRRQHPAATGAYPVAVNGNLVVLEVFGPALTMFYDFSQGLMRRVYDFTCRAVRPFRRGFIGIDEKKLIVFDEDAVIAVIIKPAGLGRDVRNITFDVIETNDVILVEMGSGGVFIGTDLHTLQRCNVGELLLKTSKGIIASLGEEDYTTVYNPKWSLLQKLSIVYSLRAAFILLSSRRMSIHLALFLEVMSFTHL